MLKKTLFCSDNFDINIFISFIKVGRLFLGNLPPPPLQSSFISRFNSIRLGSSRLISVSQIFWFQLILSYWLPLHYFFSTWIFSFPSVFIKVSPNNIIISQINLTATYWSIPLSPHVPLYTVIFFYTFILCLDQSSSFRLSSSSFSLSFHFLKYHNVYSII